MSFNSERDRFGLGTLPTRRAAIFLREGEGGESGALRMLQVLDRWTEFVLTRLHTDDGSGQINDELNCLQSDLCLVRLKAVRFALGTSCPAHTWSLVINSVENAKYREGGSDVKLGHWHAPESFVTCLLAYFVRMAFVDRESSGQVIGPITKPRKHAL